MFRKPLAALLAAALIICLFPAVYSQGGELEFTELTDDEYDREYTPDFELLPEPGKYAEPVAGSQAYGTELYYDYTAEPAELSFEFPAAFTAAVYTVAGLSVPPDADGTWNLAPGFYLYDFAADGYMGLRGAVLELSAGEHAVISPEPEPLPAALSILRDPYTNGEYFAPCTFDEELNGPDEGAELSLPLGAVIYETPAEAAAGIIGQVKSCTAGKYISTVLPTGYDVDNAASCQIEGIEFQYRIADYASWSFSDFYRALLARLYSHSGRPDEGDYLHYSLMCGSAIKVRSSFREGDGSVVQTLLFVPYVTMTPDESAAVTSVSLAIAGNLGLGSPVLSDYSKLRAIHDYLRTAVVYDFEGVHGTHSSADHNSYGALVLGKAVCQGFAASFYRLSLLAGIDCRYIQDRSGLNHAWNIVNLGGSWYCCDSTWDENIAFYDSAAEPLYFLKGADEWLNPTAGARHTLGEEYTGTARADVFDPALYPLSGADYSGAALSFDANGGSGAPARLESDGTAIIIPETVPVREGRSFICWEDENGNEYHAGGIYTGSGRLTLRARWSEGIRIAEGPESRAAEPGESVTFAVRAEGEGLTYRWQYSVNGGADWYYCTTGTCNTAAFTTTAKKANNGRLYRVIIKDSTGTLAISGAAELMLVIPFEITAGPQSAFVPAGDSNVFAVSAIGTGLRYRWQYSVDKGESWYDCTTGTYNTAGFTVTAKAANNGRLYRCRVTDGEGRILYSAPAELKVFAPGFEIISNPQSAVRAKGEQAVFGVRTASASHYRWQYSVDKGENWYNCTTGTYNTCSFTVTAKAANNGRLYRCVIKDGYGNEIISASAELTVSN